MKNTEASPNKILHHLQQFNFRSLLSRDALLRAGTFLGDTKLSVFTMGWLMVLLVGGTVSQSSMGLYEAQQKFFSSVILWAGPIPLPGGSLTMGIIFIELVALLIFKVQYRWEASGRIIAHIGTILLLFGGFFTAVFSREGTMVIPEGQSADYISDHNAREFALINVSYPDHDRVTAFASGWLEPGKTLESPEFPFRIEILKYFNNCRIVRRQIPAEGRRLFASNFTLMNAPLMKETEQNRAGVEFRLSGAGSDTDGVYAMAESMNEDQVIQAGQTAYVPQLRRARMVLPFLLELLQFEHQLHPGTNMPRSFKSVVNVIDGNIVQRSTIQMNEPLRYKGYTFYQSSYSEEGAQKTTVLSVVRNAGRLFPYISSLIMSAGLLLHLLLQMPKLLGGRKP